MPVVYSDWQCEVCLVNGPSCGYYAHPKLHRGHLAICRECHTKRTVARRSEAIQKAKSEGTWVDGRKCKPKMSLEERQQRNREKALKHYFKDVEHSRAKHRAHAAKRRADPEQRKLICARKRAGGAGLTPEQLEEMFAAQGHVCAICHSEDPGSKTGWHVDHCHATNRVRFVLCGHCNRGLGGFRDNPDFLRKAANALEAFAQADPL